MNTDKKNHKEPGCTERAPGPTANAEGDEPLRRRTSGSCGFHGLPRVNLLLRRPPSPDSLFDGPSRLGYHRVSAGALSLNHVQSVTYWILFVGAFLVVAVWESFQPRRALSGPAERRWGRHGLLLILSTVFVKVILRVNPVIVATAVAGSRFGILNRPGLPFAARCAATVLLLDLTN